MAHDGGGYPSPGHTNGAGPYPDQSNDTTMNDLEISEQLQHAAGQPANHNGEGASNAYADLQYGGQPYNVQHSFAQSTHAALMNAQFAPQHPPNTPAPSAPTAPMGQATTAANAPSPSQTAGTPGAGEQSGRKKPKISRACDECRRKKIRCDKDQTSTEPCSNCKKSDPSACVFDRVPQKRGPNKGYIRELSDRVSLLENKNPGASMTDVDSPAAGSRKRDPQSAGLEQPGPGLRRPPPGGWASKAAVSSLRGLSARVEVGPTNNTATTTREAGILQNYYAILHPFLPLLSAEVTEVEVLFRSCSESLRAALFVALQALMAPFGTAKGNRMEACIEASGKLHASVGANVASHGYATNLVYLHGLTVIIVAIETLGDPKVLDASAPSTVPLYAEAFRVATLLKLDVAFRPKTNDAKVSSELYAAGRRVWWVLVHLDLLNAMGEGAAPRSRLIGLNLDPGDKQILGETLHQLARIGQVLHSLAKSMALAKDEGSHIRSDPRGLEIALDTQMDSFHENTAPIVVATHAHTVLLLDRLAAFYTYANQPDELQFAYNKLTAQLHQNIGVYASLTAPDTAPQLAHFLALQISIARELQGQGDEIREILNSARVVAGVMKSGFAQTFHDTVERAVNEHDESVNAEEERWDSAAILDGYMQIYSA